MHEHPGQEVEWVEGLGLGPFQAPVSLAPVENLARGLVQRRQRYCVVVVTHNLSQARRIADCAALFWVHEGAGRLIESGPAERFFADPQHRLTRDYVSGARV